jgi:hypothetical protein
MVFPRQEGPQAINVFLRVRYSKHLIVDFESCRYLRFIILLQIPHNG